MEIRTNIGQEKLQEVFNKGYRVKDGEVLYKNKKLRVNLSGNYYRFSFRSSDKKVKSIMVHRLVAFQKFGGNMFEAGIQVRHLDGNPINNCELNIAIGTSSQNAMDKAYETRLKMALHASSFIKKHDHSKIVELHKSGKSYSWLMKEFNISSKGTISFIVNKSRIS